MKMNFHVIVLTLLVFLVGALCDPTMYKKNEQNLYEPGEWFSDFTNSFRLVMSM